MNEELINKVLEAMVKCRNDCSTCSENKVCSKHGCQDMMQALAAASLEERTKPKVWDGAPITADCAVVYYYVGNTFFGEKTYTRELPKTQARKDAEKLFDELSSHGLGRKQGIDAIEKLLNKYAEEPGDAMNKTDIQYLLHCVKNASELINQGESEKATGLLSSAELLLSEN